MKRLLITLAVSCAFIGSAWSLQVIVPMYFVKPHMQGVFAGTITFADTDNGVLITPRLSRLDPGFHGMHMHQNPSCGDGGNAAGGHYDPYQTNKHAGPYNKSGHLGDLPAIKVNQFGVARSPLVAPHLTVKQLLGHSIIIHDGGDTYSDTPPLGGGGARIVCGVISAKAVSTSKVPLQDTQPASTRVPY